jgi:DNA-binding MarR family transcriptional regulator
MPHKTRPAEDAATATSFFASRVPAIEVGHFASMWHILGLAHLVELDFGRIAAEHDLSGADLLLLGALRVAGGAPMRVTDLAAKMHVSMAVFSTRVVRLERAGLVRRERSPSDRRASLITLTGTGETTADAAIADIAERGAFAQAHRRLGEDERAEMVALLARLHDMLHRHTVLSPRG